MREVRKKKRYKRSLLLRLSEVCLAVYILAALIDQQIQISEKREQLAQLQQDIRIQEIRNDEVSGTQSSSGGMSDEYAEKIARQELGMAGENERVFVIVTGV